MTKYDLQIPEKQVKLILQLLSQTSSVDGDIVELGCYAGDTSLEMAKLLRTEKSDKQLWLYDSFAGLPEKTNEDLSASGLEFQVGELKVSKNDVLKKFIHANLPRPIIKKAWFADLDSTRDLPEKICFALLDGDYYESIRVSFELVCQKMQQNSVIIIHDYDNPALPGVARAVNEFAKNHAEYSLRQECGLAIFNKK